jgi:antitoxin (DNA-binding transcriptional repressor) of toxin-antitoxin stability system
MRFVSIRELRSGPRELWASLKEEDVVLTLNGKPIAIITGVSEDDLQETLRAVRQARAAIAIESMHKTAFKRGTDRITSKEIDAEIRAVRKRKEAS